MVAASATRLGRGGVSSVAGEDPSRFRRSEPVLAQTASGCPPTGQLPPWRLRHGDPGPGCGGSGGVRATENKDAIIGLPGGRLGRSPRRSRGRASEGGGEDAEGGEEEGGG
ncbi:hypothetical protein SUZIE_181015 [Sciurus carolinensis]|uniref:Uncharacterized protein n=1 Tax=Sciurus carolinensis TaxID=30640 RepID=A0AA41N763_SCICA|nr:hypothetical protein [Sciurus carolinensis]